jgi:outer membrane protein insertion porin family
VLFAVALFPGSGRAQDLLSGGNIGTIRIDGIQRIEAETVRSYMRVNPGDPFDPIQLDKSLKNLFSTGLFADVTLRREGNTLVVSVVENPIINRVAFEGNDAIEDDALRSEILLRPRVVFTRTKAQQDAQRLLEIYRRSGRFAARVEPKVVVLEQNRVDLIFEIKEGPKTKIRTINFIGNRVFSDSDLRDEISSREEAFWRFFSAAETYDPDRLAFDQDLLRRFYLKEGYADFQVLSSVAELLDDREGFFVTITVEEGKRYRFGKIDLTTTLKDLDPESLRDEVLTEEGEWYNAELVEKTVDALIEKVGNLGFAFVDVRPRASVDREARTIGLSYDVVEGPKVYVERIDIEGNVRTLDEVIRREFRLVEGDAFSNAKLRTSERRLENLGFFKTVEVKNERGSVPDRTVIKTEVEEQSTGDITFSAGFSSAVGPIGSIGIRERNLLGKGQDLRLGISLAGEESQLDLSFTEPYFLDRELAAGFDLFRVESDLDERAFDLVRTGGSVRAGFSYNENLRHVVRYTLENKEVSDVDEDASLLVQSEEGEFLVSSVAHELTYDTRDSRFDTHEGFVVRLSNQVAGLGGDVFFLKSQLGGNYYFPLAERWTFRLGADTGFIIGLGEDTRISDRFYIGGNTLRGFDFAGVGPRDLDSMDPIGGNQFWTGTAELSFPLGLPEEYDVRGRLFVDVGANWDFDGDVAGATIEDSDAPRVSVGTGVTWNSPFGPIVIDLGFAVVKEDFDETEVLNFSFGTSF